MTTRILLDSGAYSAFTQQKPVSIEAYAAFIKANHHLIDHYVNLDVINDGEESFKNYKRMRKMGLDPIPVYHAETNPKYLQYYLTETDYIAIGAIAKMNTRDRIDNLDEMWVNYMLDKDGLPLAKFHGFGLTSQKIVTRYPWASVDSTSWVQFSKYGAVLVPKTKGDAYNYTKNPEIVCVSSRAYDKFKHIDNYDFRRRQKFIRYFREKGFVLGKSVWEDGGETIVQQGLCNDGAMRDRLNLLYYLDLQNSLPPYPWSFKRKVQMVF